jgi:hypothetical protein
MGAISMYPAGNSIAQDLWSEQIGLDIARDSHVKLFVLAEGAEQWWEIICRILS